jgi:hypothetical protein
MEKKMEGVLLAALSLCCKAQPQELLNTGPMFSAYYSNGLFRLVYHFIIGVTVGLGQPLMMMRARVAVVQLFSGLIRCQTSLNHVAQAARAVLRSEVGSVYSAF